MLHRIVILLACLLACAPPGAWAEVDAYAGARAEFMTAWSEIDAATFPPAAADSEALRSYPLYPYLQAARLEKQLSARPDAEIRGSGRRPAAAGRDDRHLSGVGRRPTGRPQPAPGLAEEPCKPSGLVQIPRRVRRRARRRRCEPALRSLRGPHRARTHERPGVGRRRHVADGQGAARRMRCGIRLAAFARRPRRRHAREARAARAGGRRTRSRAIPGQVSAGVDRRAAAAMGLVDRAADSGLVGADRGSREPGRSPCAARRVAPIRAQRRRCGRGALPFARRGTAPGCAKQQPVRDRRRARTGLESRTARARILRQGRPGGLRRARARVAHTRGVVGRRLGGSAPGDRGDAGSACAHRTAGGTGRRVLPNNAAT